MYKTVATDLINALDSRYAEYNAKYNDAANALMDFSMNIVRGLFSDKTPHHSVIVPPERSFTALLQLQADMDADPNIFKAPIGEPGERASRAAITIMAAAENAPKIKAAVNREYDRVSKDGVTFGEGVTIFGAALSAFPNIKYGRRSRSAPDAERVGGLGPTRYVTDGDLLQSIATRADNWGARGLTGNGPVVGTYKHGYSEAMLNRYQRMFGDRGLAAEARYVNGGVWERGMPTSSSIRLDVVKGPLDAPTFVWDYKFGGATLSPSRITTIQNGIPGGASVQVLQVKP
jgi:hypothetical protein